MTKIERAYTNILGGWTNYLPRAREFELKGELPLAIEHYSKTISSLDEVMLTDGFVVHQKWTDTSKINRRNSIEILAKVYLAQGKVNELSGNDSIEDYIKSFEHYSKLYDLCNEAKGDLTKAYALEAKKDLAKLARIELEPQVAKSTQDEVYTNIAKHMPSELSACLKSSSFSSWGTYWNFFTTQVAFTLTDDFAVVLQMAGTSESGNRTTYDNELNLFYCKKGSSNLNKFTLPGSKEEKLRDAFGDEENLELKIIPVNENTIEVSLSGQDKSHRYGPFKGKYDLDNLPTEHKK